MTFLHALDLITNWWRGFLFPDPSVQTGRSPIVRLLSTALFPLDREHFGVGPDHLIDNKQDVDNHTDNRHGISGYLDDAAVARVIFDALVAD